MFHTGGLYYGVAPCIRFPFVSTSHDDIFFSCVCMYLESHCAICASPSFASLTR